MTDEIVHELEQTAAKVAKLTTAERLAALEQLQAETHRLVAEVHANVAAVATAAAEVSEQVRTGGIGSLLGGGGLGGLFGGHGTPAAGSSPSRSPRDAILGALLNRR